MFYNSVIEIEKPLLLSHKSLKIYFYKDKFIIIFIKTLDINKTQIFYRRW